MPLSYALPGCSTFPLLALALQIPSTLGGKRCYFAVSVGAEKANLLKYDPNGVFLFYTPDNTADFPVISAQVLKGCFYLSGKTTKCILKHEVKKVKIAPVTVVGNMIIGGPPFDTVYVSEAICVVDTEIEHFPDWLHNFIQCNRGNPDVIDQIDEKYKTKFSYVLSDFEKEAISMSRNLELRFWY